MACTAMYLFKEGSRNAFNNERDEEQFKMNYEKLFKVRLPHMDTVDKVMRQLKVCKLDNLKQINLNAAGIDIGSSIAYLWIIIMLISSRQGNSRVTKPCKASR